MDLFSILSSFSSKEVAVMVTAALPIIELRGAIPFGMALGFSAEYSFWLSLIGGTIPVPLLMWFTQPVFLRLRQTAFFSTLVDKLCARSLSKSQSVQRYGFWGLLFFVAVPLPGTGVWSGALVATLLNMPFRPAFLAIFIGNFLAGIAVMILSYGAFSLMR